MKNYGKVIVASLFHSSGGFGCFFHDNAARELLKQKQCDRLTIRK